MWRASRPSRAKPTGRGRGLSPAAIIFALSQAVLFASPQAQAQTQVTFSARQPPPPIPTPGEVTSELSAAATVANLGSSFLERLGNQMSSGFRGALRNNPDGGGASEATE